MTSDLEPFQLSNVLTDLYHQKDLLDLSAPGPSSPPRNNATPTGGTGSLFASASSIVGAAGRRAAAVASGQGSPASPSRLGRSTGLERDDSVDGTGGADSSKGSSEQRIEIRCVEAYGSNLYLGRSDGVIEWWTCDGSPGSNQNNPGWTLRNKHTLFPRRPMNRLTILPQVSRCFALSEGTIHPLSLPFLEPLPSTVVAPLRGVVSVILDDDELEWDGEGSENNRTEMTVVIVRRRGLGIYRMGGRMIPQKEIPLPSPPSVHALASNYLCACLPHSSTYALIDFSDASLTEVLPVSQVEPSQLGFDPKPNIAVVPGEGEFLVTSYTGVNTMGVFLNGQGDPVRGTVEWAHHPLSLTVESGYILALLRNHSISIHTLSDLEAPVQTISLDPTTSPFAFSYTPYGVAIRNWIRDDRMASSRMILLSGKVAPSTSSSSSKPISIPTSQAPDSMTSPSNSDPLDEPPSGSGLTPPSSPPPFSRRPIAPQRSSSLIRATAPSAKSPFSTTITETLIVGPNGLQAISPTSAITKLEILCKDGKIDDAMVVVEEERQRGKKGQFDGSKAIHQGTMRFLHLYLACYLIMETRFEAAGDHLYRGKIDPRLLVRLFARLRGKVIGSAEEIDVFEGLKQTLMDMPTVETIITTSIKRNYSPHVSPDTAHAPETIELRHALEDEANAMLTEFLRKTRTARRKGGGARGLDSAKIDMVIDTTLAKLLADAGTTNELLALLAGPNDVVLGELEPFLEKRPYVLSTVMRQQGKIERTLAILKGIAESPEGDPLCEDPVDEIAQQLDGMTDPQLLRQYALWLVGRDPTKGLEILISQSGNGGVKLDDEELLGELRQISEDAANVYLEHVVVQKRSPSRPLHEELLTKLIDTAEKQGVDDGIKYHLEELESEFRLGPESQPFCVFLADVAPQTPIKLTRLKLQLFLCGSPFYSLQAASARLATIPWLKYELAIVLGRQGKDKAALQLLARDVGDSVSAQTYCTQGGEVIPPKVAHDVASHVPELAAWATLGDVGRKRRGTVDAAVQEGLVMHLLGVYMKESNSAKQTASLLNAQSLHLDALEVLKLIPPDWPLETVSAFFQRSLRRQLHDQHTWQILKSISAGQNLAVSDEFLNQVRSMPPILDTSGPKSDGSGVSPGFSIPDEGSIPESEKVSEKEAAAGPGGGGGGGGGGGDDEKLARSGSERTLNGAEGEKRHTSFFSPEGVVKELAEIRSERHASSEGQPRSMG